MLTILSQALSDLPVSEAGRKWVRSPYVVDDAVGRDRWRASEFRQAVEHYCAAGCKARDGLEIRGNSI